MLLYFQAAGAIVEDDLVENIFELQHHHLLRCLEKTTVNALLLLTCLFRENCICSMYIFTRASPFDHFLCIYVK